MIQYVRKQSLHIEREYSRGERDGQGKLDDSVFLLLCCLDMLEPDVAAIWFTNLQLRARKSE